MVTCQHCGADIPANARFCPRCGNYAGEPVEKTRWQGIGDLRRSGRRYRQSAGWAPKTGLLKVIMLGLLVIYAGIIMYLASSGMTSLVGRHNAWAYLLAGLGAYLFARFAIGYLMR